MLIVLRMIALLKTRQKKAGSDIFIFELDFIIRGHSYDSP